jgi:hypothetical protein
MLHQAIQKAGTHVFVTCCLSRASLKAIAPVLPSRGWHGESCLIHLQLTQGIVSYLGMV